MTLTEYPARSLPLALCITALFAAASTTAYAQTGPIRIGVLAPLTGPLATPGAEMVDGLRLYWEQVGNQVAGRKVVLLIADTTCKPDQALT